MEKILYWRIITFLVHVFPGSIGVVNRKRPFTEIMNFASVTHFEGIEKFYQGLRGQSKFYFCVLVHMERYDKITVNRTRSSSRRVTEIAHEKECQETYLSLYIQSLLL